MALCQKQNATLFLVCPRRSRCPLHPASQEKVVIANVYAPNQDQVVVGLVLVRSFNELLMELIAYRGQLELQLAGPLV